MKWLITGSEGQLGRSLSIVLDEIRPHDHVTALPRRDLDITNADQIAAAIEAEKPDLVVNCAAWTHVDLAEIHQAEARDVNTTGPSRLAAILSESERGILVQISTDYVFGGHVEGPHREDDAIDPQCVYARTKADAEAAVREILPDRSLIIRTAWLYGEFGSNFAKTVIRRVMVGEPLRVLNDQLGQPTFAFDVAARLVELAGLAEDGLRLGATLHATNSGSATRWQFATEIARLMGLDATSIEPIETSQLGQLAPRPSDSRLEDTASQLLGIAPMRRWDEAVAAALPRLLTGWER